ncbi:MAG: DUF3667 domain-containing protein [Planctomycetes bacterium]|nr:DUF3667 domain-containing protein [Planctomycetota bacterium]
MRRNEGTTGERIDCPTCGGVLERAFCPACGEKRPTARDTSTRAFVAQVFGTLFSVDGKLLTSLRRLARPGFLTTEFLRGARVRQFAPFQLFALLNVVYFVVQPWTGTNIFNAPLGRTVFFGQTSALHDRLVDAKRAELGLGADADWNAFAARFDPRANDWAKSLIVVFVPSLALASFVAHRRPTRRFGEQLALVTEFLSFKLLFFSIALPVAWSALAALTSSVPPIAATAASGVALSLFSLAVMFAWFVVADRRAFASTPAVAVGHALVIVVGYLLAWFAYHVLLFVVTLWSL